MDAGKICLENPVKHAIRVLIIYKSLFKVVDAIGEDLPVGRDFVGTVDEAVDGCCFIMLGALTITVEVLPQLYFFHPNCTFYYLLFLQYLVSYLANSLSSQPLSNAHLIYSLCPIMFFYLRFYTKCFYHLL